MILAVGVRHGKVRIGPVLLVGVRQLWLAQVCLDQAGRVTPMVWQFWLVRAWLGRPRSGAVRPGLAVKVRFGEAGQFRHVTVRQGSFGKALRGRP